MTTKLKFAMVDEDTLNALRSKLENFNEMADVLIVGQRHGEDSDTTDLALNIMEIRDELYYELVILEGVCNNARELYGQLSRFINQLEKKMEDLDDH